MGMERPQQSKQEKKEKTLQELQSELNELFGFMSEVLKTTFGSLEEARKQASLDTRAGPDEEEKVRNKNMAADYLRKLDILVDLKQEYLDQDRTEKEVGVSGRFKKLADELEAVRKDVADKTSYYGLPGFFSK